MPKIGTGKLSGYLKVGILLAGYVAIAYLCRIIKGGFYESPPKHK
jgi:hypothetical protein